MRLSTNTFLLVLLSAALPPLTAQSPVGMWLSEERTEAGMGQTLELSSDGRIRLSQGIVIGEQWTLQEHKKKGFIVQIVDPATGNHIRSVQLEIDADDGRFLIETDLTTGDKFKMAFVSKGNQSDDPPFLGRWQFVLARFGILAVHEYTDDGWVWLRAPISAEIGTYQRVGDKIMPQWPGEYSPLVEIIEQGRILIATTPEGRRKRFLPPKILETLTSRSDDPRK